jgi:hypothetical protein
MKYGKRMHDFRYQGYVIIGAEETGLNTKIIQELKAYINTLEVKRHIPFSNVPWGWGSLLGKGPFTKITENIQLNSFCGTLFRSKNYVFPNMMINNKAKWIGPEVEWHREIFNIDTYAPGYSPVDDWQKLLRVYIPLDKQTKENGCLELYKQSHKIEHLEYEDIIDSNFGHKRRITSEAMDIVNDKCKHFYCELNPGDMLIFNDKIVHGSRSNKSQDERKSIVLGVRHNVKEFDKKVYTEATKFRERFIIENLQSIVDKMKHSENLYTDFNKEA